MSFHSLLRPFKSPRQKAADFQRGRTHQSDAEFLAGCGIPAGTEAASAALSARRVVATLGRIEPEWIHCEDRWPDDLALLTFWDSLDFLEITLRLEKELQYKIRGSDLFAPEL